MLSITERMHYMTFSSKKIYNEDIFSKVYMNVRVFGPMGFMTETRYNTELFPSLTFLEY